MSVDSDIVTDHDQAFAYLNGLSARVGWYAFYKACVRYLDGHTLVVPNTEDKALFEEAARALRDGVAAREKMEREKLEKGLTRKVD